MGDCQVALANLDAVLLESRGTFEMLPEHVLAQLEEVQRLHSPHASASPQADSELPSSPWCRTDDLGANFRASRNMDSKAWSEGFFLRLAPSRQ